MIGSASLADVLNSMGPRWRAERVLGVQPRAPHTSALTEGLAAYVALQDRARASSALSTLNTLHDSTALRGLTSKWPSTGFPSRTTLSPSPEGGDCRDNSDARTDRRGLLTSLFAKKPHKDFLMVYASLRRQNRGEQY